MWQRRTQPGDQRSAASLSPVRLVPSLCALACPPTGAAAGKQRLSSVPKEVSQQSAHRLRVRIRTKLQDTQSPNSATRAQAPSTRSPEQARMTPAQGTAPGRSCWRRWGGDAAGGAEPGLAGAARRGRRSGGMRQCRAAGLAGLAAVLLVAVSRAQVQQETAAETTEGIEINITCSHPNIQSSEVIYWYRQLPGRGPAFLVSAVKVSKEMPDPEGRLWVSADRRSSALLLARPRLGDAAVYYCALVAREAKPGLRPGTNRLGRGGGTVPSGPAGGAACMTAKLHPDQGAPP